MAMITSAMHTPWPCDVEITDLSAAGLSVKSIIRMKLFTIDQRLILGPLGTLSGKDQKNLALTLKTIFKI
jgi:mRNA interferase MazF